MKTFLLKNKILKICLAFAIFMSAMFVLTACGDEKDSTKQDRQNTVEILRVYQDSYAQVYAEVTGFEHTDYEFTGNSVLDAYSLEFSINNGSWFVGGFIQDFYNEDGRGIYQLLNGLYNYGDTKINSYNALMTGQSFAPGEISISVRIPESNTYNASAGTKPTKYTLKQNIQTLLSEKLRSTIASLGSQGSSDTFEEEKFVFYQDSSNPYNINIGKYYSQANNNGGYDYFVRELTSQEESELSSLNLEYKVLNYNPKYMTTIEGTENKSVDTLSIQGDDNDSVYNTAGWVNDLSLNQSNRWTYVADNFYYEDVIFIVRQKATENTVQSSAICFQVNISFTELSQLNN